VVAACVGVVGVEARWIVGKLAPGFRDGDALEKSVVFWLERKSG